MGSPEGLPFFSRPLSGPPLLFFAGISRLSAQGSAFFRVVMPKLGVLGAPPASPVRRRKVLRRAPGPGSESPVVVAPTPTLRGPACLPTLRARHRRHGAPDTRAPATPVHVLPEGVEVPVAVNDNSESGGVAVAGEEAHFVFTMFGWMRSLVSMVTSPVTGAVTGWYGNPPE